MAEVCSMLDLRFGKLLVIERAENSKHGKARWLCQCDCGLTKVVGGAELRIGDTTNCGCVRRLKGKDSRGYRHGMTRTREYWVWAGMMARCYDTNHASYANYGGRGIQVCERWHLFDHFFADMGRKPFPKATIDRKNNNGNYEPENVKWSDRFEQGRNRRNNNWLTIDNETLTISEWSRRTGVSRWTIRNRIRRGFSAKDAVRPTHHGVSSSQK
jgi:hypothetical protein